MHPGGNAWIAFLQQPLQQPLRFLQLALTSPLLIRHFAVDSSPNSTAVDQFLVAVRATTRSQAALPSELPLSEWHCSRLLQRHDTGAALLLLDAQQQGRVPLRLPAAAAATSVVLQVRGVRSDPSLIVTHMLVVV